MYYLWKNGQFFDEKSLVLLGGSIVLVLIVVIAKWFKKKVFKLKDVDNKNIFFEIKGYIFIVIISYIESIM